MKRFLNTLAKAIAGLFLGVCMLAAIGTVGLIGYLGLEIVGLPVMLGIVAVCAAVVWAILRLEP